MHELNQLKRQWNDSARLRGVQANLCLGPSALTLGAGTVVAKRNHDGSLALDGEETKILTLLSVAYGQALDSSVLKTVRRASAIARDGDDCKAAMHLALAKLPRISDPVDAARRLFIAEGLIASGVAPHDIWKALEFDPAVFDTLAKYNRDQPRVPAGSGKPSGEWTSGGTVPASAGLGALATAATVRPAALSEARSAIEATAARIPKIAQRLPRVAMRLATLAAHLNLWLDVAEEVLRPSDTGGQLISGKVSGMSNAYYERYQDEPGVRVIDRTTNRTIATLLPTGVRGQYANHESGIVAQMEGTGLVVRSAIGTASQAQTRKKEPDECPEPGLDLPGMIGARGLRSKGYENYMKRWLNPGKPTPSGVGFQLENPVTGKLVYYDDCQHETGLMAEYKGVNFARIIAWATRAQRLDVLARLANRWVKQATSQIDASEGRPVAWFFAEQGAVDFAHTVFSHAADPRLAEVALSVRPPPEKRAWWRDYAKRRRREVGTSICTGRSRSNVSAFF